MFKKKIPQKCLAIKLLGKKKNEKEAHRHMNV